MSADLFEAFGASVNEEQNGCIVSLPSGGVQGLQNSDSDEDTPNVVIVKSRTGRITGEPLWQTTLEGQEILFDASENEIPEDDFGDFEDLKDEYIQTSNTAGIMPKGAETGDLSQSTQGLSLIDLSLDESSTENGGLPLSVRRPSSFDHNTQQHQPANPESFDNGWGNFEDVPRSDTRPTKSAITIADREDGWQSWEAFERPQTKANPVPPTPPDDDWDTFEDGQAPLPVSEIELSSIKQSKSTQPEPRLSSHAANPPSPRPTTVPPPSLLLSLFPSLIAQTLQPSPQSPSAQDEPTSFITLHHTLLRILSGRSHRWRRDLHLSQSTRISAAGKPGGMKLTSLSKDEKMREEREAAEAVESWNRNLHLIVRGLADAKLSVKTNGLRIMGSVVVREMKGPGVLEDRLCCAVCGLKRSERVIGLEETEDVFGEFWIDSWGHLECEWWYRSAEVILRRR